jgi:hypothetical protein
MSRGQSELFYLFQSDTNTNPNMVSNAMFFGAHLVRRCGKSTWLGMITDI